MNDINKCPLFIDGFPIDDWTWRSTYGLISAPEHTVTAGRILSYSYTSYYNMFQGPILTRDSCNAYTDISKKAA
jgi:hypothetical protein